MKNDLAFYTTPVAVIVTVSGADLLSVSGENTIELDDIEF